MDRVLTKIRLRSLIGIAALTLGVLALDCAPASAHTVSGAGATNYRTQLQRVDPEVAGLHVSVQEAGNRMQLVNNTASDVVVLGYEDEPYLRVGPTGVYENRRSPTLYLNTTRYATTPPPSSADAHAVPDWHKVNGGRLAVWHDHRVHWMSTLEPPQVRAAPDQVHVLISQWQINMTDSAGIITSTGNLTWVPSPRPWPWIFLAVGSGIGTVLSIRYFGRLGIIASVVALVLIDVEHVLGLGLASAGQWTDKLARLGGSFYSVIFWAAGVWAIRLIFDKRDSDAAFALVFFGMCIAVISGLGDASSLDRSQLVFAGPWWVARAAVALSLGVGFALATTAALRICHYDHAAVGRVQV